MRTNRRRWNTIEWTNSEFNLTRNRLLNFKHTWGNPDHSNVNETYLLWTPFLSSWKENKICICNICVAWKMKYYYSAAAHMYSSISNYRTDTRIVAIQNSEFRDIKIRLPLVFYCDTYFGFYAVSGFLFDIRFRKVIKLNIWKNFESWLLNRVCWEISNWTSRFDSDWKMQIWWYKISLHETLLFKSSKNIPLTEKV